MLKNVFAAHRSMLRRFVKRSANEWLKSAGGHEHDRLPNMATILARHGRYFVANRRVVGSESMPGNQPYANAFWHAMNDSRLAYCEGYACSPVGKVIRHAWVIDENGLAYERTWDKPGLAYVGMAFRSEWLILFHGGYHQGIENGVFEHGEWPLYRHPYDYLDSWAITPMELSHRGTANHRKMLGIMMKEYDPDFPHVYPQRVVQEYEMSVRRGSKYSRTRMGPVLINSECNLQPDDIGLNVIY